MRVTKYLLDTNVFITAKNTCYSFGICPGFWDALIQFHNQNRIYSISQVRKEIMKGKKTENLVIWVRDALPDQFFKSIYQEHVQTVFRNIITSLRNSWELKEINQFTKGADCWLVAYAKVYRYTLVTFEVNKPKHKIQIPQVCELVDVSCINLYQMLMDLNIKFVLK